MKAYHRIGTALLCAVLFFCAACSPTTEVTPAPTPEITPAPTPKPTPAPAPEPTPTPALESAPPLTSWEEDPGQFILDNLNVSFSNGRLPVWVSIQNGSGPFSTALLDSECGQELRDLFSAYDWEVTQAPQHEDYPFDILAVIIRNTVDENAPRDITCSTNSDVLCLRSIDGTDGTMENLYFRADGAEKLSRDLAALCPSPDVQTSLVVIPVQETIEDTARNFMDEFFAVMKENGHITDGEVSRLTVRSTEEILFDVHFRLKPAQPKRDIWTNRYSVDRSGWTNTIKWRVCLTMDEDGKACRLDWSD